MVTEDKNKIVSNSKANILIIRWHHLNSHSGWRHFMAVYITFNCCCGGCNNPTDKFQHFPQAVEWTSVSVSVWETNRKSLDAGWLWCTDLKMALHWCWLPDLRLEKPIWPAGLATGYSFVPGVLVCWTADACRVRQTSRRTFSIDTLNLRQ